MSDSCCCIDYDNDPSTVFVEEIRTARKKYLCCECNCEILSKQKYENVRGLWDGKWSEYKTCLVCANVRKDRISCGWTYTTLWDDLRECFYESGDDMSWLHPMFEEEDKK